MSGLQKNSKSTVLGQASTLRHHPLPDNSDDCDMHSANQIQATTQLAHLATTDHRKYAREVRYQFDRVLTLQHNETSSISTQGREKNRSES